MKTALTLLSLGLLTSSAYAQSIADVLGHQYIKIKVLHINAPSGLDDFNYAVQIPADNVIELTYRVRCAGAETTIIKKDLMPELSPNMKYELNESLILSGHEIPCMNQNDDIIFEVGDDDEDELFGKLRLSAAYLKVLLDNRTTERQRTRTSVLDKMFVLYGDRVFVEMEFEISVGP